MAKTGMSIRLRPDLKQELERRAKESGTSAAALYERLIDEGLRRDAHPLIAFRDGAAGRRATLAGSRLTVAQIIDTLLATEGASEAERVSDTAEYLDIPVSYVRELFAITRRSKTRSTLGESEPPTLPSENTRLGSVNKRSSREALPRRALLATGRLRASRSRIRRNQREGAPRTLESVRRGVTGNHDCRATGASNRECRRLRAAHCTARRRWRVALRDHLQHKQGDATIESDDRSLRSGADCSDGPVSWGRRPHGWRPVASAPGLNRAEDRRSVQDPISHPVHARRRSHRCPERPVVVAGAISPLWSGGAADAGSVPPPPPAGQRPGPSMLVRGSPPPSLSSIEGVRLKPLCRP